MVLGSRARQSTGHDIRRREPEFIPQDHRTRLYHHRINDVDNWRGTVRWAANVLPSSARPYSSILFLTAQTEDNHSMFPVPEALVLSV